MTDGMTDPGYTPTDPASGPRPSPQLPPHLHAAVFDQVRVPLWLVTPLGAILATNAAARSLGDGALLPALFSDPPLVAEMIRHACGSNQPVRTRALLAVRPASQPGMRDSVALDLTGMTVPDLGRAALASIIPARQINQPFVALRDELLQARQAIEAERHQRRTLEQVNQALESFAATAAHDLISPLASVRTALSMLGDGSLGDVSPAAQKVMSLAGDTLDRLNLQIRGLLDHASARNATLQPIRLDLERLARQVWGDLSAQVASSGAQLTIMTPLPPVEGDESLIQRLFLNLFDNAIKYRSPERPLTISLWHQYPGNLGGGDIVFQDNGVGFDLSRAAMIFEPFKRLHTVRTVKGVGIGLATCRAIAERHGWLLTADGEPGVGARFVVALPPPVR